MFPKKFKKLYKLFAELGKIYEETQAFDQEIVKKLGGSYEYTKFQPFL